MSEKEQLAAMGTEELASYWNVLMMGRKCLQVTDDPDRNPRHSRIVGELLAERGVKTEDGRLLLKA